MVFAENQEKNESYTFKDMWLQPEKSYIILAIIKEVEANESRSHWTLMKNSEVNNKQENKFGKLKTILSIWSLKRMIFPYGKLMKHKARLCAHGGMQQWVFDYW